MGKIKLLCCLIVVLLTTEPLAAQLIPDSTLPNTLLWKISGKGLKTPSYLYGTTHVFCKRDIVLPEIVKEKILSSGKIFLEVNIDTAESVENMIPGKKYFTHDYSIRDVIGKANFEKAKKIINNYQPIADDTLNKLNLTVFNFILIRSFLDCEIGSYDYAVASYAEKNGKNIGELDQNNNNEISGNNFLDNAVRNAIKRNWDNMDYNLSVIKRGILLYQGRRITDAYMLTAYKSDGKESDSKARVLDNRNALWVPVMKKAMKKEACVFAFGCAHLAGLQGIIALLQKKGYIVTPVLY